MKFWFTSLFTAIVFSPPVFLLFVSSVTFKQHLNKEKRNDNSNGVPSQDTKSNPLYRSGEEQLLTFSWYSCQLKTDHHHSTWAAKYKPLERRYSYPGSDAVFLREAGSSTTTQGKKHFLQAVIKIMHPTFKQSLFHHSH